MKKENRKKIACQTGKEQIREPIFEELAIPWHIQNPIARKAKGPESGPDVKGTMLFPRTDPSLVAGTHVQVAHNYL